MCLNLIQGFSPKYIVRLLHVLGTGHARARPPWSRSVLSILMYVKTGPNKCSRMQILKYIPPIRFLADEIASCGDTSVVPSLPTLCAKIILQLELHKACLRQISRLTDKPDMLRKTRETLSRRVYHWGWRGSWKSTSWHWKSHGSKPTTRLIWICHF